MCARRTRLRVAAGAAAAGFVLQLGLALPLCAQAARAGRAGGGVARDSVRYIGVWEPVNYAADLVLTDAYFATPDVGWVVGGGPNAQGGVILYTRDAGAHWDVQVGDPQSTDREYRDLRFVDAKTGFAVQTSSESESPLLRTTDGENWSVTGTIPTNYKDYVFTSATTGFAGTRPGILRTDDAGKSWKPVLDCNVAVQVQGLTRQVQCEIDTFSFPTPQIGFALGMSYAADGMFVAKTEDGGATWQVSIGLPDESGNEAHLHFLDGENAVACLGKGSKLVGTHDGGVTWSVIPGPSCDGKPAVKFAGQVGWTVRYNHWNFTTNGGRRWTSRDIAFPAGVNGFALPRSDRGYAVGDHGMIYRYSVVPDTTKLLPGAIKAAAMPRGQGAPSG